MGNILIVFEVKDNTTDNNLKGITTILSEQNGSYRVLLASKVKQDDIVWSDVLIANRPNSVYTQRIVKAAKQAGRFVICSLDDDIINLPLTHPHYWRRRFTLSCLEMADVLMSTSQLIIDDYCSNYHLRPLLVDSFVKNDEIKCPHKINGKIRIVYPAGKDHIELYNRYISPFIQRLLDKYQEVVDLTFIGICPDINQTSNVHLVEKMSYEEYLKYMYNHDFDIGLAPLDESAFSARKYFAKYIEYSRFSIMGIYSNVKPYTYVVKNNVNGVLVDGEANEWEVALYNLINNSEKIMEIVNNAQDNLRQRFSLSNAVRVMQEGCPELETYHSSGAVNYKPKSISTFVYSCHDIYTKSLYHLRHDGIKYIFNR